MSTNQGDVRSTPPAPGSSPSGANEGLHGVLESFTRLPGFGSMLERVFGLVRQHPGDLRWSAALSAPSGWLVCDGATYDIAAYPRLYQAIGKVWGGDGVRTFAVPNLCGRVVQGAGFTPVAGVSGRDPGDDGGAETASLAVANLPAHSHAVTDPGHAHAAAQHSFMQSNASLGNITGGGAVNYAPTSFSAVTATNTTGITTQNTGSGSSFPILNPYVAMYAYIYAG